MEASTIHVTKEHRRRKDYDKESYDYKNKKNQQHIAMSMFGTSFFTTAPKNTKRTCHWPKNKLGVRKNVGTNGVRTLTLDRCQQPHGFVRAPEHGYVTTFHCHCVTNVR